MAMTPASSTNSLQHKASQLGQSLHSTDEPNVVKFPSRIELQAAKRLRRSAAKALLSFMNSRYTAEGNET